MHCNPCNYFTFNFTHIWNFFQLFYYCLFAFFVEKEKLIFTFFFFILHFHYNFEKLLQVLLCIFGSMVIDISYVLWFSDLPGNSSFLSSSIRAWRDSSSQPSGKRFVMINPLPFFFNLSGEFCYHISRSSFSFFMNKMACFFYSQKSGNLMTWFFTNNEKKLMFL